jgi:hypothetical protein
MLHDRTLAHDSGTANQRYVQKLKNYRAPDKQGSHSRWAQRKNQSISLP